MGIDPDLPAEKAGDIRRVTFMQRWASQYRFQAAYLLVLYGLLAIKFRIQDITDTLISNSNGRIRGNCPGWSAEHTSQVLSKSFWLMWRVALPLAVWKVPIMPFVFMFLSAELITGYFLAFNFQVSHVTPSADFPEWRTAFDDEWAVSQIKTTLDYDHTSMARTPLGKIISFMSTLFCGALNYQTEHHLFPCISQYHYPAIAPIVREVAAKYGVRYNYVPTFWHAFGLHVKHLHSLGNVRAEQLAHMSNDIM